MLICCERTQQNEKINLFGAFHSERVIRTSIFFFFSNSMYTRSNRHLHCCAFLRRSSTKYRFQYTHRRSTHSLFHLLYHPLYSIRIQNGRKKAFYAIENWPIAQSDSQWTLLPNFYISIESADREKIVMKMKATPKIAWKSE